MKYYLVAGEASGDLHGSNLMKAIRQFDPQADFRYFGGELMQQQGGVLVKHYRDMAFMGLFMVLANLCTILRNMKRCKNDIAAYSPDAVILVDFPGFNLKIAEYAHKKGFRVLYYISPKIWAWRKSRVHSIRKYVDKMYVLLPFEVEFYRQYGVEAEYLGNPVVDAVAAALQQPVDREYFLRTNSLSEKPIIALLPGSRRQEISKCLPEMMAAAASFPAYQFVIAGAPSMDRSFYEKFPGSKQIPIIFGKTYDLLRNSYAAVVVSGTATLETGLFGVPQVVIYKPGILTYRIGILFVKIRFFSLVNLFMDKPAVKELLQFDLAEKIAGELTLLTSDAAYRREMLQMYEQLREKAGEPGTSARVAEKMVAYLRNK